MTHAWKFSSPCALSFHSFPHSHTHILSLLLPLTYTRTQGQVWTCLTRRKGNAEMHEPKRWRTYSKATAITASRAVEGSFSRQDLGKSVEARREARTLYHSRRRLSSAVSTGHLCAAERGAQVRGERDGDREDATIVNTATARSTPRSRRRVG